MTPLPSPPPETLVPSPSAEKAVCTPYPLSGLALAGADRRDAAAADEEDGILTAEEIACLDLSGVEWAVLSACNTGVGDIHWGEGVLGARRAFQVAGARTLVSSLSPVDDESTRRFMGALYEARLERGLDTAECMREAALHVLRRQREARGTGHPASWAAFVAAGDWR
jgi:CHAT domain-containing protein